MELWTEYEGVTIDGAYPLTKLVRPEGRSAFFSTKNSNGESVFIRLIECHFDEDEILARWRGVRAMGHPNFLNLDRFGQLEMDGTTVAYAVFERVDTDLAQVLERGRLSFADTVQLAISLSSALETLHTNGFVHEHLEPRNIFAVGETVKLRSDCIRETPEGDAGFFARQRDVHDLALVLLQALTQKHKADIVATSVLPAPFDEIVRNGTSGAWGLTEVRIALQQTAKSPWRPTPASATPSKPRETVAEPAPAPAATVGSAAPASPAPTAAPKTQPQATRPVNAVPPVSQYQQVRRAIRRDIPVNAKWFGAALLLVLVLLVGWLAYRGSGHTHAAPATASGTSSHSTAAKPSKMSTAPAPAASRPSASPTASSAHGQWRVVTFTYNRRDQAQKKSASMAAKHPDLRPEVFTPTGRAPYLVTIGGALGKDEAYSLARRAHASGLPRDTYAQNYR